MSEKCEENVGFFLHTASFFFLVPTANKRLIGVNGRTTYDRHYNDNASQVAEQIRDVGRRLGVEALRKHYNRMGSGTGEWGEWKP